MHQGFGFGRFGLTNVLKDLWLFGEDQTGQRTKETVPSWQVLPQATER